jgi:phenylacetate-CoA ligase
MDTVTVRVESEPGESTHSNEQLIKLLSHKIKTFIGISAAIVIEAPKQLPRSEGKAKRVIDNRT